MKKFKISFIVSIACFVLVNFLYASDKLNRQLILKMIKEIDGTYNCGQELQKYGRDISPILIEHLESQKFCPKDFSQIECIIRILGSFAEERAPRVIVEYLKFIDTSERASDALVSIGPASVPHIIKFLQDPEIKTQKKDFPALRAIQALQKLPDKGSIQILSGYLDHNSPFVQYACAIALGNIGDENTVGMLLEVLNGGQDILGRIGAAHALGLLGRNDGFELCKECIEKRKWRCAAIEALREIQHPDRVSVAISALDDKDFMARKCAVQMLGDIGTESEVPILENIIEYDDEVWVKKEAKKAIDKIKQRIRN